MIKPVIKYMTQNDCYKLGAITKKEGVMVHLTATPGIMAKDWFSRWNKAGVQKAVHYFVDDKDIYQYLPEKFRSWHGGKPGVNNTLISIEGCEPPGHKYVSNKLTDYDVKKNTPYFNAMWENYTDLVADICDRYGFTEKDVISHNEAGQMGIASASSDPNNLFKPHGKTMADFRADVRRKLKERPKTYPVYKEGDKNAGVMQLQVALIRLGFKMEPYGADGSYGKKTREAVIAFQNFYNLQVDGIAGPETQGKIDELIFAMDNPTAKDETVDPNLYYRVVAGSYNNRSKAEQQMKLLESLGVEGVFLLPYRKE